MLGDTIFAIASPPGAGARGIIRVSGPEAFDAARAVLGESLPRCRVAAEAHALVLGHRVACLALVMPGPRSYTGEDVVELHLPGGVALLDEVCQDLLPMARLATPGEFTRRAYLNGRLDLPGAEAVLDLIHAADLDDSRFAVRVLHGGLAAAVAAVRSEVQDALAFVEAGLDFGSDETGTVEPAIWQAHLTRALHACRELEAALPESGIHGELLLLGAANAGKSSLLNALAGGEVALVADVPGTTRDVLAVDVAPGLRLLDGPGDLECAQGVERDALVLRDQIAASAAGVLLVVDATCPRLVRTDLAVVAQVDTKCDLAAPGPLCHPGVPRFGVSSVTGAGLDALLGYLSGRARAAPSGLRTRVHAALRGAATALATACDGAAAGVPEELLAVDLQDALRSLDSVHGRSVPDDVLDRIFAAFCLGK
ncbi:MAG: 50S ribosome-binding GTPase [Planctomycetes bacterium]|nr:50S ribosome-binding GTPase [Planctomycetota bacterium]MCB9869572.1 50S ribosome-binding GTPase [Planctomycetota bacterium]